MDAIKTRRGMTELIGITTKLKTEIWTVYLPNIDVYNNYADGKRQERFNTL